MITIRKGLTRTVVLTRRWAVKLPRVTSHGQGAAGALWSLARGLSANLSEREWADSPGVCPLRWSLFGLVNVYPRCDPVVGEPTERQYAETGFTGPADNKADNVGMLDGVMVYLDYDVSWNDRPPCAHAEV